MATNFVKERVNELLISQSLSVRKLSEQIGVPQKTLNNQVNVSNPALLTLETILLILERFPNVSTEWLLRGNGSMFLDEKESSSDRDTTPAKRTSDYRIKVIEKEDIQSNDKYLDALIEEKNKRIADLIEDKKLLHSILQSFTNKDRADKRVLVCAL